MTIENPFYLRDVANGTFGYYERPVFSRNRFEKNSGNDIEWSTFRELLNPFIRIKAPVHNERETELLFSDKDIGWGTQDINLWIGGDNTDIFEISDLSDQEGHIYLQTALEVCRELSSEQSINHSFSIGFNPLDLGRPGHHNVKRIHGHLRACEDPLDLATIQQRKWKDMHWVDRTTFIEPFTDPFYEFIRHHYENREKNIQARSGIISMPFDANSQNPFTEVKDLYMVMKEEFEQVRRVFTDQQVEPATNRYVPYPQEEREQRLKKYLEDRPYYSEHSRELLQYLARFLKPARTWSKGRENYIQKADQVHIDKGFAGAFSFIYDNSTDNFTLNFLPRVITFSAVAKVMFGQNRPTIMGAHKEATEEQRTRRENFKSRISLAVDKLFQPVAA